MKKIYLYALFLFICIVSGCGNNLGETDRFNLDESCREKYLGNYIKPCTTSNRLECGFFGDYMGEHNTSANIRYDMFYSPKTHSCIFAYKRIWDNQFFGDDFPEFEVHLINTIGGVQGTDIYRQHYYLHQELNGLLMHNRYKGNGEYDETYEEGYTESDYNKIKDSVLKDFEEEYTKLK